MLSEAKEELLKGIIDIEMEFFRSLKTEEPVAENALPALRRMRWMTYSVFSDNTLILLLRDLCQAKQDGRNTMLEKYALIDGLIPPIQENDDIKKIVEQETAWMEEVHQKYPKMTQGHDSNKDLFSKYMSCELQSWSPEALKSYLKDVYAAVAVDENMAKMRYDNLYESLGKGSLEQYNSTL